MNKEINTLNAGDEVLVRNWDDSLEKCKLVQVDREENFLVVLYSDGELMRSSFAWLENTFVRRVQHTLPNN